MRLFFTLTKKRLAILLLVVIAALSSLIWVSSLELHYIDGSTHAKRMEYIRSQGVLVEENGFTEKETLIPETFGEVYLKYNELQKKGGFNLSPFKGEAVTVYSYRITGADKTLTLIVHEGEIIGGDIAENSLNGKMREIKRV